MRYLRTLIMLIVDALLINMAVYTAMLLRFEGQVPTVFIQSFVHLMPLITAITILALMGFKLYSRMWEYASIGELFSIVFATTISMATIIVTIKALNISGLPRSVYILSWIIINLFIGLSRLWWRLFRDYFIKVNQSSKRILIVGAGDAGALLAREIQNNPNLGLEAAAFVDDDPGKKKKMLLGLPVKGGRDIIPELVKELKIDEIIIAMPSVTNTIKKEIIDICKKTSASLKMLPDIYQSSNGTSIVNQLRNVQMEDLLGREPVRSDLAQISGYLHNKTVLVTGGGGSIGSELCRQVVRFNPHRLVIVDCCENNLFDIEMELKAIEQGMDIAIELVDIRNRRKLEATFQKHRPQVIFHAAAYKHVPMMERHPEEALHNNVIGTRNVAEMADKYGAETFILISTDKAVNPSSVMGATKRIAELVTKDINRTSVTRFAAVRFGNVLGSRGSVIPTFMKQIAKGGPVTVTHPDMTRFFMTIPEAVELVIQAGALARGGETFVLDMGDPVKISDLARDLIKLSGYEPDREIQISYTGIRPGEKLYEELFLGREEMASTRHERIFISTKELDDNYTGINKTINVLVKNALPDRTRVLNLIKTLVPEYQRPDYTELKADSSGEVIYLDKREKRARKSGSLGN